MLSQADYSAKLIDQIWDKCGGDLIKMTPYARDALENKEADTLALVEGHAAVGNMPAWACIDRAGGFLEHCGNKIDGIAKKENMAYLTGKECSDLIKFYEACAKVRFVHPPSTSARALGGISGEGGGGDAAGHRPPDPK